MARARQRIVSRRRMQKRIKAIADDTQNTHSNSRHGLFVKDAPERPLYLRRTVSE
jgi:hypothetical protein